MEVEQTTKVSLKKYGWITNDVYVAIFFLWIHLIVEQKWYIVWCLYTTILQLWKHMKGHLCLTNFL